MIPAMIAGAHPDLAEVTSFLDVGTGVGLLAVAAAAVWPSATVVGIDPWETSLERARANVAGAGLDGRVTLRSQTMGSLHDVDAYDCAWIPTFFVTEAVLQEGLAAYTPHWEFWTGWVLLAVVLFARRGLAGWLSR